MSDKETTLIPLILDLAEPISVVYDEDGQQVCFGPTTNGTYDEIDSGGTD